MKRPRASSSAHTKGPGRGSGGGGSGHNNAKRQKQEEKRQSARMMEIEDLRKRVLQEAPEPGTQPFVEGGKRKRFVDIPISSLTRRGLELAKYEEMTEIQLASIPHALAGRDVLGAAKTGSGKTLAFVIPMLEKLFRERWGLGDGLGALIITPTRELALQIFEVVRKVGKCHQLSAGLVTGGKKEFREEQLRLVRMNIVVATPGRLLQHLEGTPGFDPSQIQMLILDEADRILDLGFSDQLNSILRYLPSEGRQTLLFSATQTKSVKDLARLSLTSPEFVGVHEKAVYATPEQLIQSYVVCTLPQKLDVLWSFIKSHLRSKMIVFFSSCSQVRYVYECFRSMQPGVPVLALHGKIKQMRRTHIYFEFVKRPAAVLFATDIAARGLDFPACDWVVQVDTPEDTASYIHRVGRTARYKSGGRSLLFLLPNEEPAFIRKLGEANVPIKKLTVNPAKNISVKKKAAAVVASNPECKRLAQKAFKSYLRSVLLMPDKEVFDVKALPTDEFAEVLGLPRAPSLKFLKTETQDREEVRQVKNRSKALERLKEKIKAERAAKKGLVLPPQSTARKVEEEEVGEESEDDLLLVKKKHDFGQPEEGEVEPEDEKMKKPKKLRIRLDKPSGTGKKIVFQEDSEEESAGEGEGGEEDVALDVEHLDAVKARNEEYIRRVQEKLKAVRDRDRALEKERIREKHLKKRMKVKGELPEEVGGVTLGGYSDEEDEGSDGSEDGDRHDDEDDDEEEELALGYGNLNSGSSDEEEDGSNEEEEDEGPSRPGYSLAEQEELVLRRLRGGK